MSSLSEESQKDKQNRDVVAIAAAKAVLDSDEELQYVHSTKSVASMVKNARDRVTRADSSQKIYNEVGNYLWY